MSENTGDERRQISRLTEENREKRLNTEIRKNGRFPRRTRGHGEPGLPGGAASRSRQSREGEGRTPGETTEGLPKGEDANRRGGPVGEGKGRRECPMCNFYMGRGRSCRYENELNQTSVSSLTSSMTLNKSLNLSGTYFLCFKKRVCACVCVVLKSNMSDRSKSLSFQLVRGRKERRRTLRRKNQKKKTFQWKSHS